MLDVIKELLGYDEYMEAIDKIEEKFSSVFKPDFVVIADGSMRKQDDNMVSSIAYCIINLNTKIYTMSATKIKSTNSADAELRAIDFALRELGKITDIRNAKILFISDNEPLVKFMVGDSKFDPFKKPSKISDEIHNNRIIVRSLLFGLNFRAIHIRGHHYSSPEKREKEIKRIHEKYGFSRDDIELILKLHDEVDKRAGELTKQKK